MTLGWPLEHPRGILRNSVLSVYVMVSRSGWHGHRGVFICSSTASSPPRLSAPAAPLRPLAKHLCVPWPSTGRSHFTGRNRFGSVPRSVPAGSEIKRFSSVRPVRFGFLLVSDSRLALVSESARESGFSARARRVRETPRVGTRGASDASSARTRELGRSARSVPLGGPPARPGARRKRTPARAPGGRPGRRGRLGRSASAVAGKSVGCGQQSTAGGKDSVLQGNT